MIEVKNLSFSYGEREILHSVSFSAKNGELVGILGNNGAGKSTLVTCINRINTPGSGTVLLDGEDIAQFGRRKLARNIAYVAQKNELTQATVFDCVLLGRKPYIKWSVGDEDVSICDNVIERVGLAGLRLRPVDELSGGELQKVMLARALVQEPKVLVLDEPTSNLDPRNQHEMMKLVRTVADERGITVLVVIHDLSLAMRFCDKFLLMKDGSVFRYGGREVLSDDNIFPVYGMHAYVETVHGLPVVVMHEDDWGACDEG